MKFLRASVIAIAFSAVSIGLGYAQFGVTRATEHERFMSLMEQFMPRWQSHRELLNRLPVRREKWVY
jgi:hypothetical protein